MSELAARKIRWCWFYTLAAIIFLFLVGLLVSLLISSGVFSYGDFDTHVWRIWRVLSYGLLVGLWPVFIRVLLNKHRVKTCNEVSRLPVVVLIILYELLIVQNPLKVLLSFWG